MKSYVLACGVLFLSTVANAQTIFMPAPTVQPSCNYEPSARALTLLYAINMPRCVVVNVNNAGGTVVGPVIATPAEQPLYFRMRDLLPPESTTDADVAPAVAPPATRPSEGRIVITPTTKP